jgi:CheY-like chemotaxis protein
MLTANALPQHVEAAHKAGADGHIAKPVTPEHLMAALRSVAEPRGQAAEQRVDAA